MRFVQKVVLRWLLLPTVNRDWRTAAELPHGFVKGAKPLYRDHLKCLQNVSFDLLSRIVPVPQEDTMTLVLFTNLAEHEHLA